MILLNLVILVSLVNLVILVNLVKLVILVKLSFHKIFGFCGLRGHIVEISWDVTLVHGRTHAQNAKIGQEFRKQNLQKRRFHTWPKTLLTLSGRQWFLR